MTNPLEQIRELAKSWRGAYHSVTERDLGNRDGLIHCSDRILAILDASQGYACVPVEQLERWRLDLSQGDMRPRWEIEEFVEASKETNRG